MSEVHSGRRGRGVRGALLGVARARLLVAVAGAALASACAGRSVPHPAPPDVPPADPRRVDVTLFLIGDAGVPLRGGDPVLRALAAESARAADTPTVVFLGDNVYPRGIPARSDPGRREAERRLGAQLEAARQGGARALFVPGNHDWDAGADDGWAAVRREEAFVRDHGGARARLVPGGGCPGPAVVDLGRTLRLVLLDTQWWLQGGPKPEGPGAACPTRSPREVLDSVRAAVSGAGARRVIVAGHHGIESGGKHAGSLLASLLSLIPIERLSAQNMNSAPYSRLRAGLDSVLGPLRPLAYAAGHDHGLQVIAGGSARYFLVSGAGSYGHLDHVRWLDSTRYAASQSGYMRVDVLRDGRVRLGVRTVDAAGGWREPYADWIDKPWSATAPEMSAARP